MAHGGPSTDVKEPPELTLNCSSQLAVPLSVSTPDVADLSPSFVDMTKWPSRHHSGFSKPALPCYNITTSIHRLITVRGMVSGPNGKRTAVTILFDTGSQADCISNALDSRMGYTEQSINAHARTASSEHLRAPMLTSLSHCALANIIALIFLCVLLRFPLSMSFSSCPGVNDMASILTQLRVWSLFLTVQDLAVDRRFGSRISSW